MTKKKFTHLRMRKDGVTFAGGIRSAGEVVPVMDEGLESLPPQTIGALCEIIEVTENCYAVLEAGTLESGAFVPLAVSKGDQVEAVPQPYEPQMPVFPVVEEPDAEEQAEPEEA